MKFSFTVLSIWISCALQMGDALLPPSALTSHMSGSFSIYNNQVETAGLAAGTESIEFEPHPPDSPPPSQVLSEDGPRPFFADSSGGGEQEDATSAEGTQTQKVPDCNEDNEASEPVLKEPVSDIAESHDESTDPIMEKIQEMPAHDPVDIVQMEPVISKERQEEMAKAGIELAGSIGELVTDELIKPLLSPKIEKGVSKDVIKGAAITGASLSFLAGQGLSMTGAAAAGAAYLAVTPGKGGETVRTVGDLFRKSANTAADLYRRFEINRLVSSASKAVLVKAINVVRSQQGDLGIYDKNNLEEMEKLQAEMYEVLTDVEDAVTKAEAEYDRVSRQESRGNNEDANTVTRALEDARQVLQSEQTSPAAFGLDTVTEANLAEEARLQKEAKLTKAKARQKEEARLIAEEKAKEIEEMARQQEGAKIAAEKAKEEAAREKAQQKQEAKIAAEKAKEEAAREKAQQKQEAKIAAEKAKEEAATVKAQQKQEAKIAAEKAKEEAATVKAQQKEAARLVAEENAAAEREAARIADEERIALEARLAVEEEARQKEEARVAEKVRLAAEEKMKLAEVARLAAEDEARLAEEAMLTAVPEEDIFFEDEDWEASIRLAEELDRALPEDALDPAEKDGWDAASRLAEELAVRDDGADSLELSPEELAAQAKAAREAVEMFETRGSDAGLQNDDDEPSDLDLEEIDMEIDDDVSDFFDNLDDLEDLGKLAREAVNKLESAFGDDVEENSEPDLKLTDWSKLTVAKLKTELKNRGLQATGKKADLVAKLENAGNQQSSEEFLSGEEEDMTMESLIRAARETADLFNSEATDTEEIEEDATMSALATYQGMTVAQLKDELRSRGMKVGGRKVELIERLLLA